MPEQTIDHEITQAKRILENWALYAQQIARVRQLERGTMYTPAVERKQGYRALEALQGYQQIINAYQLIGNVTPAQNDGLGRVSEVLGELQFDRAALGSQPSPAAIREYSSRKLQELENAGETYMVSGHKTHFNITKIAKLPGGGYSYTLYDAGHESKVVDWKGDRPVQTAVQENRLQAGVELRQLIETDVLKYGADPDGAEYKQAKEAIGRALIDPPLRAELEYGQRKGNCTTRGQRILAADILKDPRLSEGLYDFASSAGGTSTAEIKRLLERRIEYLERLRTEGGTDPARTWSGLPVATFVRAADAGNYEAVVIPLDGGGMMPAYRTKPAAFGKDDLEALQGTLERNGLRAAVRESMRQPGHYYIYVPVEDTPRIAEALARDNSSAADLYRHYGPRAESYVEVRDFIRRADPANYEYATIPQPGGGGLDAFRTKPGLFAKPELDTMQEKLRRGGLAAAVQESASQPGTFYLYVPRSEAARVEGSVFHDDSPAAALYRHYGAGALEHIAPVAAAAPSGPVGYIGDQARWHTAQLNAGRPVTRIATTGMRESELLSLENELVKNGFRPVRAVSETLGPTLRIEGSEVERFQRWQKDLAAWHRKNTGQPGEPPQPGGSQVGRLVAKWAKAALNVVNHEPEDTGALIKGIQQGLNVPVTGIWTPDTNKALERLIVCAQMTPEYIRHSQAHGGRGDVNGQYDEATHKGLLAMASSGGVQKSLIKAIDRVNAAKHMNDLYHGPIDLQDTLSEVRLGRALFNLGPPPQPGAAAALSQTVEGKPGYRPRV